MTSSEKSPVSRRRRSVSQRALIDLLTEALAGEAPSATSGGPRDPSGLRVVDLGGGTGGVAATLAAAGHHVLVVDPSPDALAATERRAAEHGLGDRLTARQGDTTTLAEVVDDGSVDVVLCHLVLDRATGTAEALTAMARALKPGGALSIVIGQRYARVLKQAMAGSIPAASALLADTDLLDRPALLRLLGEAGCVVESEQGVGVIADHVGEDAAEGHADALLALERACAENPAWLETATRLHVLARRE
ncbi:methyltransferase domain-containing protein [Mariniluteicoccus flavus]